jgi:hypothetical protein
VARKVPAIDDLRITMKKLEFLVAARKLANDKARELGWNCLEWRVFAVVS